MKIRFHQNFDKQYKKLRPAEKNKTLERLQMFLVSPFDSLLDNHSLKGKYVDYRSINITGDLRALYKILSDDECIFVVVDSHSNLYK